MEVSEKRGLCVSPLINTMWYLKTLSGGGLLLSLLAKFLNTNQLHTTGLNWYRETSIVMCFMVSTGNRNRSLFYLFNLIEIHRKILHLVRGGFFVCSVLLCFLKFLKVVLINVCFC